MEAGLVTGGKGKSAGLVDEGAEGERQLDASIGSRDSTPDVSCLIEEFTVDQGGFDDADAENAPAGGDHFVDQVGFYGRGGLVGGDVFGANALVQFGIFARE